MTLFSFVSKHARGEILPSLFFTLRRDAMNAEDDGLRELFSLREVRRFSSCPTEFTTGVELKWWLDPDVLLHVNTDIEGAMQVVFHVVQCNGNWFLKHCKTG